MPKFLITERVEYMRYTVVEAADEEAAVDVKINGLVENIITARQEEENSVLISTNELVLEPNVKIFRMREHAMGYRYLTVIGTDIDAVFQNVREGKGILGSDDDYVEFYCEDDNDVEEITPEE